MSIVAPETTTRAAGTAGAAPTAAPSTRLPAPIPGDRPTHRVPFLRLVRVELRKMLDTLSGRWLLISVAALTALVLVIQLWVVLAQDLAVDYLQATTMPMAMLLPLVGILAVTSEWSQRTALVTFALEARRVRVAWAKVVAAMVVGVGAVAFSLALGTAAHASAIAFRGIEGDWTMSGLALAGAAGYVLLGLAQGLGFGMLLRNTPAAIVLFFVLPTAWSLLSSMVSWVERAGAWLDMNRTMQPLFTGSLTGEQWAQLGTSVGVWVALPLALGMWRLTRAEVK